MRKFSSIWVSGPLLAVFLSMPAFALTDPNPWLAGLRTAYLSDLDAKKCGPIESKDIRLKALLPYLKDVPAEASALSDKLSSVTVMKLLANALDREACRMRIVTAANPQQLEAAIAQILAPVSKQAGTLAATIEQGKNFRWDAFERFARLTAKRLSVPEREYASFKKKFEKDLKQWIVNGQKSSALRFLAEDEVPDEIYAYFKGTLQPSSDWVRYGQLKPALEAKQKRMREDLARQGVTMEVPAFYQVVELPGDAGAVLKATLELMALPEQFSDFRQAIKERLDQSIRYVARTQVTDMLTFGHWRNAQVLTKTFEIDPIDPSILFVTPQERKEAYEDIKSASFKLFPMLFIEATSAAPACLEKFATETKPVMDVAGTSEEAQKETIQKLLLVRSRVQSSKECAGAKLRFRHWTQNSRPLYDAEALPFAMQIEGGKLTAVLQISKESDKYIPFDDAKIQETIDEAAKARKVPVKRMLALISILKSPTGEDLGTKVDTDAPNPFAARRYRVVMNKDEIMVKGVAVQLNDTIEHPREWLEQMLGTLMFEGQPNGFFEETLKL